MSIIDAINTIGKISVPLRRHKDDLRYQPNVGEPTNYSGVGNFRKTKLFSGHHLKTCSSRETYKLKTTQNLLICCYDIWLR